ncbi:MAG: winged helix-turn-helix transcriptional regulator [Phycisphaerae bacterium]|nr:winged helix-turn-helix transcriptional regulator [Phycisphaerae bacterium]
MPARSLQHEIGKKKPFDSPEVEAFLNLARTHGELSGPIEHLLGRHALSPSAYNVLRILRGSLRTSPSRAAHMGRRCAEIGAELVTRVPDVTRLVDRLVRQGYVERRRCTRDRRVVYVRITGEGLAVLAAIDRPLLALHRAQLAHMTRADLAALSRLLVKARRAGSGATSRGS